MNSKKTSVKELNRRKEKRRTIYDEKLAEAKMANGEFKCICGASYDSKPLLSRHKSMCEHWKCEDGYKICRKCFEKQSIHNFHKDKRSSDGLYFRCASCESKRKKLAIMKDPEAFREKTRHKYANGKWLKVLEWREKNKERLREKRKSYIRKDRKTGSGISHNIFVLEEKLRRDSVIHATVLKLGGKCAMCGETESEFLTIDHIFGGGGAEYAKRGYLGWKRDIINGVSDISKYRVLCHNCNSGSYRKKIENNDINAKTPAETGVIKNCISCGLCVHTSLFPARGRICRSCIRKKHTETVEMVYKLMGNKCNCCGETETHKLTLDHIDNDGAQARRDRKEYGMKLYNMLLEDPSRIKRFQLLCWNCNMSKYLGGGICKHARKWSTVIRNPEDLRKWHPKIHDKKEFENFSFKDVKIVRGNASAKEFLDKYHYAGFGRGSVVIYEAFLEEKLIAVVKLSKPIRIQVATSIGRKFEETLELDRMCVHPDFHKKNFISFMLGKVVRKVRSDFPSISCLVSFADPRVGHDGKSYTASNWKFEGKTSPSYFYVSKDANKVHKKTVYNRAIAAGLRESEFVNIEGMLKVFTKAKLKFSYDVRPQNR